MELLIAYVIVGAGKFKIYLIEWLETQARVEVAVLSLKFVGQAGREETGRFPTLQS